MRRALSVLLVVLAAGCSAPSHAVFPATDVQADAPAVPRAPGVMLHIRVSGGGDRLHVHAEGVNGGEETLRVPSACAETSESPASATQPFSIAVRRAPSDVGAFAVYPERGCRDVVVAPFRPGERRAFDLDWNGTVWSEAFGPGTPFFAGDHALDVAFEVYAGAAAEPTPLVATVPFSILPDGSRNAYLASP